MSYGSTAIVESQPMGLGIFNNVSIKSIEALTTEPKRETDKAYEVLDIVFQNETDETYRLRLFNSDEDTDHVRVAKGQVRNSNTIAYVAGKIKGEETSLDGSKIKSWKDFTAAAIKLLGDYSGKAFQFKTVGNVWNGKAKLVLPVYWGWLESMESSKKLAYSQSEKEANAEYESFFANRGGSGALAEDDDTPF